MQNRHRLQTNYTPVRNAGWLENSSRTTIAHTSRAAQYLNQHRCRKNQRVISSHFAAGAGSRQCMLPLHRSNVYERQKQCCAQKVRERGSRGGGSVLTCADEREGASGASSSVPSSSRMVTGTCWGACSSAAAAAASASTSRCLESRTGCCARGGGGAVAAAGGPQGGGAAGGTGGGDDPLVPRPPSIGQPPLWTTMLGTGTTGERAEGGKGGICRSLSSRVAHVSNSPNHYCGAF